MLAILFWVIIPIIIFCVGMFIAEGSNVANQDAVLGTTFLFAVLFFGISLFVTAGINSAVLWEERSDTAFINVSQVMKYDNGFRVFDQNGSEIWHSTEVSEYDRTDEIKGVETRWSRGLGPDDKERRLIFLDKAEKTN